MKYYDAPLEGIAMSIPAAEHSTITSWGKDGEIDSFKNMLEQFGGEGKIVAVVSDSYDIYNATANIWGEQLKDEVKNSGGTLVIRPDSGDPTIVPVEVVEILGDKFGYEMNSKGYKVLPSYVRVIQGDGIHFDSIKKIMDNLMIKGWSVENVSFGMGGALLQQPTRDTMSWAMKCSAVCVNGTWNDVFKDPITDKGKTSKKGRIGLEIIGGLGSTSYRTNRVEYIRNDLLTTKFENGALVDQIGFMSIRENSNKPVIGLDEIRMAS